MAREYELPLHEQSAGEAFRRYAEAVDASKASEKPLDPEVIKDIKYLMQEDEFLTAVEKELRI